MLIRKLNSRQVFIVPDGTTYPQTAYEIVTKQQLDKERATRNATKVIQEKGTITKPSLNKKPSKTSKKRANAKKKK